MGDLRHALRGGVPCGGRGPVVLMHNKVIRCTCINHSSLFAQILLTLVLRIWEDTVLESYTQEYIVGLKNNQN